MLALRGFDRMSSGVAGAAATQWTPCRSAARGTRSRSSKPMFRSFASSYGIPMTARAAWAWFATFIAWLTALWRRPQRAMESLLPRGIRDTPVGTRGGRLAFRAIGAKRVLSDGHRTAKPSALWVGLLQAMSTGSQVWRPPAPCGAGDRRRGIDRARLQSAMPSPVFTGARYMAKKLAEAYASMDVLRIPVTQTFCQIVQRWRQELPVIAQSPADRT